MNTHKELKVSGQWFYEIRDKRKRVEGRPGPATRFDGWTGETILIYTDDPLVSPITRKVIRVTHYDTLDAYLDAENWSIVGPHFSSRNEVYAAYLSLPQAFHDKLPDGMNAIELE